VTTVTASDPKRPYPVHYSMSSRYLQLVAAQKAAHLALDVGRSTRRFPKHDVYGLALQMRRAAESVCIHMADAKARHSQNNLFYGRGSLLGLLTHLSIASDLEYFDQPEFESLKWDTEELLNVLNLLIRGNRSAAQELPFEVLLPT
jgi:four helix bundle protein